MISQLFEPKSRICLFAGCLVICIFQWIAFTKSTSYFWPFHHIPPYKQFPEDYLRSQSTFVGVSGETEISLSERKELDYQILKQFYLALEHSTSEKTLDATACSLIAYVNGNSSGPRIEGLRLYDQEWDLKGGEIMASRLKAEFFP